MAKSESIPKWVIGLIIACVTALAGIGAIAINAQAGVLANRDAREAHKETQKTQFQDIKEWLVRIDGKIDKLGAGQ